MKAYNKLKNELSKYNLQSGPLSDFINVSDFTQDAQLYINMSLKDFKEEIYYLLDNVGAWRIDIIYYNNAINYLREKDFSLTRSIELAEEAGFQMIDLNSELLASLLASDECYIDFYIDRSEEELAPLKEALVNYLIEIKK